MRPFFSLFGVAFLLTACGSAATTGSSTAVPVNSALYPFRNVACVRMARCGLTSSQMMFSMSADHGPPGTVVALKVTGCLDPTDVSHGISYNGGAKPSTWRKNTLSGTYRVNGTPGSVGEFVTHCYDTTVFQNFTITK